jgi:hypothetical protein
LEICQGLFRISGNSKGADIEEERAKALNIPVFYTIADLLNYEGLF